MTGDSFTMGVGVSDAETIAVQLNALLGSEYEVMNMGAAGWAIDQMAVLATKIAPRYEPRFLIIGFIADDLERTCSRFAWGNAPKPYFTRHQGGISLSGVPIPSPEELREKHSRIQIRIKDAILVNMAKLRVFNLLFEPLSSFRNDDCRTSLNADILRHVSTELRSYPELRLIIAHLDGDLPKRFVSDLRHLGIPWLSVPDHVESVSRRLGIVHGRSDRYHPDRGLARVMAQIYFDEISATTVPSKR